MPRKTPSVGADRPAGRVNVRDIARLAGCSSSTVSRVLSGNFGNVRISQATQERIQAVCADLRYEPNIHASRLFGKRTGVMGLIIPSGECGLQDENLSLFTNAVYQTLSATDSRLLLLMLNERFLARRDHLSLMRRREVDGLIVWGPVGTPVWLDELAAGGMPFVLSVNRAGDYPCVYSDDAAGMAAMVAQVRARGARHIAYVDGSPTECGYRRRAGFLAAAADVPHRVISGSFTLAAGRQAGSLLAGDLPDAIVCASDHIALGVVMGLRQAGIRVPEDVLVTGADNIPLAEVAHPALTTYDQMSAECGRMCAQMLLARVVEETPLTTQVLAPIVHRRESA